MAGPFRRFARFYFATPSSKGFSPYRTGGCSHQLLSLLIGHVLWALLRTRLDLPWILVVLAVVAAIGLLWGIGAFIGIYSHYNLLIPAVLFVAFVVAAALQGSLFNLGLLVGWLGHMVWLIALPEQGADLPEDLEGTSEGG